MAMGMMLSMTMLLMTTTVYAQVLPEDKYSITVTLADQNPGNNKLITNIATGLHSVDGYNYTVSFRLTASDGSWKSSLRWQTTMENRWQFEFEDLYVKAGNKLNMTIHIYDGTRWYATRELVAILQSGGPVTIGTFGDPNLGILPPIEVTTQPSTVATTATVSSTTLPSTAATVSSTKTQAAQTTTTSVSTSKSTPPTLGDFQTTPVAQKPIISTASASPLITDSLTQSVSVVTVSTPTPHSQPPPQTSLSEEIASFKETTAQSSTKEARTYKIHKEQLPLTTNSYKNSTQRTNIDVNMIVIYTVVPSVIMIGIIVLALILYKYFVRKNLLMKQVMSGSTSGLTMQSSPSPTIEDGQSSSTDTNAYSYATIYEAILDTERANSVTQVSVSNASYAPNSVKSSQSKRSLQAEESYHGGYIDFQNDILLTQKPYQSNTMNDRPLPILPDV